MILSGTLLAINARTDSGLRETSVVRVVWMGRRVFVPDVPNASHLVSRGGWKSGEPMLQQTRDTVKRSRQGAW